MKRNFVFFSLFILVFALQLGICEARTYKIGMIHWIAYSPLNIADQKGIWKNLGLDVEVINFGSNQELNNALEHKKIDIALDMLGSWVGMYLDGVPLKIICETDWSNGGDKIIAKKEAKLDNLKGQSIGVYLNQPSVLFFLNKYFLSNNIKLSDAKIIELEPEAMADNFIAGKFNIIVNYDPQALRAEKDGNGKIVATSATYEGCIPEGFVSRTDVLETIPKDDLVKIFKGWIEAVKWAKDEKNWPEFQKILNTKTFEGEKPYSEKDLKDMLGSVKIHDAKTQLERNKENGGTENYLKDINIFLKDNNMLKKEFSPKDIFDSSAIIKALN